MRSFSSFRLALFFFLCPLLLPAQDNNTESQTIDPDIRAAQLYLVGAPLTLPIVELKAAPNTMLLEFDHLSSDLKDYLYTIVHCDSDWQPSDLTDNEYIDGFTEDRITNIESSFNTLHQYTHYSLGLPNRNMRWSRSGNYILKVFDNDDERRLVLVRRFCVVEPRWRVDAKLVSPVVVSKLKTHHEIDFSVNHRGTRIFNPQNDVKAFVLQNGRWDSALGPLPPFITREDQLVFDYQDKVVFPAGKEWRFFDIRTFEFRGERVKSINQKYDFYEVTLETDKDRSGSNLSFRGDLNGRYSVENQNYNQTLLQCDYARVLFSISRNLPFDDEDVYVFGELTDWQLKPEFKMEYSPEVKAYYCESPLLKQGYYNYGYQIVNRETGEVDEDGFEGNSYETSNLYTVLVYFRVFGERYDRLMAAATIDSRDRR